MSKQAPNVRKALLDVTTMLSVKGTTSREVVNYVKANLPNVVAEDQAALIDLGLMVVAGRVAVTKFVDSAQLTLFSDGAPNQFMKLGRRRIQTRTLTLGQWEALTEKPTRETNKVKTHNQRIAPFFEEMAAKGLSKDTSLGVVAK